VVKVHAAEALLIVDGHGHLLKKKDNRCQSRQTVLIPERKDSFKRYVDQMQDPVERRVSPGREEFAGSRETICFVLTGGISVLMCLMGYTKCGDKIQEAGWSSGNLEVVLPVEDYDSSTEDGEEDSVGGAFSLEAWDMEVNSGAVGDLRFLQERSTVDKLS